MECKPQLVHITQLEDYAPTYVEPLQITTIFDPILVPTLTFVPAPLFVFIFVIVLHGTPLTTTWGHYSLPYPRCLCSLSLSLSPQPLLLQCNLSGVESLTCPNLAKEIDLGSCFWDDSMFRGMRYLSHPPHLKTISSTSLPSKHDFFVKLDVSKRELWIFYSSTRNMTALLTWTKVVFLHFLLIHEIW